MPPTGRRRHVFAAYFEPWKQLNGTSCYITPAWSESGNSLPNNHQCLKTLPTTQDKLANSPLRSICSNTTTTTRLNLTTSQS